MPRTLTTLVSIACSLLIACSHPQQDPAPSEAGHGGEPGKLPNVHSKQFRVAKRDYFTAMNEFYSFVRAQGFDEVDFAPCFSRILDSARDENQHLPCLGLYAIKGSPSKAHMTFTVLNKDFNRSDYNDFLTCRIDIYVNESYQPVLELGADFRADVDGRLEALDRKVATGFSGPSYGLRGR